MRKIRALDFAWISRAAYSPGEAARALACALLMRARVEPSAAFRTQRPNIPVDPCLVAAGALVAGGLMTVAPWEVIVLAVLLMTALCASRRASWRLAVVVFVLLAAGEYRARQSVSSHERLRLRADRSMPSATRCSARARVMTSPVRVREALRWDAELTEIECDESFARAAHASSVATLYGGPESLARDDVVDVVATLAPPQRLWNDAGGDPRPSEARRGILRTGSAIDVRMVHRATGLLAWIDRVRARVRHRIDATFPGDLAPMARALVLGENDLQPDDDQAFRASGLSHLLAVSGMHLVLVLALAVRGLESALVHVSPMARRVDVGRIAALLGLPIAWVYAEFAGAGGSTLRAAWMASAALLARALGRRADAIRGFGLSVGVMAALDPLVAFDVSFALSAGATGGLLAFARPIGASLSRVLPSRAEPLAIALATTVAASLPCTPLIAQFSPTFPIGGVFANLLAVPVGECGALPLCLLHAALAAWPAAERGAALAASGALAIVRVVARTAAMPWATVDVPPPTSWQLVVLAAAIAFLALRIRGAIALALTAGVLVVILESQARRAGAPRGVLRATFLDVGQGDAALIDLPNGDAVVIDGGGLVGSPIDVGVRVVAPELRARRRRGVAVAVLTHPHPDHFGGLAKGLAAVRVGALWDTHQGERENVQGAYAELLASERGRGVPVEGPELLCGHHALGGAEVDVLAPCPAASSDWGPNDNSFVIRIAYGRRAFLFVGDAEHEEENALLSRGSSLRADVLKVGHHGSRTSSSPAFLAAVSAREAIISVGRRNRFGHPHAITLTALASAGLRIWRTDIDGAVIATTDGESLQIHSMLRDR